MRFDSYHPTINFIFFTTVIACSIAFTHPVFLLLSYALSFIYSVKLKGKKAVIFNTAVLIPFMVFFIGFYSSYNHFGVTDIFINFIGNHYTLESIVYGAVIAVRTASVIMWLSCVHEVVSSDKVVYLFGVIAPKLSLFLSIILRTVPQVKERAKRINAAQRCVGRGAGQGNIFRRMRNWGRIVSILVTWTLENFVETAQSMRCRGYGLKGRTAFSIYRFDNRDRSFVVTIFLCLTVIASAIALDQTRILYNPEIIMNRMTPLSLVFYIGYAFLCLLPMNLQIVGEMRFKHLIKNAESMSSLPGFQSEN